MPGQVTDERVWVDDWQLTSVGSLSHLAVIAVFVAAVLLLIWTWRSLEPRMGMRTRLLLLSLRTGALIIAVLMLLQPTLRFRRLKSVPSEVAVLIDVSDSMARGDADSRLSEVTHILEQNSRDIEILSRQHKISYYSFADTLKHSNDRDSALKPHVTSSGTDIFAALSAAGKIDASTPLAGILLLSDGADTGEQQTMDDDAFKNFADELGVPVNTVAITRAGKRKDLCVIVDKVNSFAFSRTETSIDVKVNSSGLNKADVELTLRQAGSIIQRKTVDLVGGKGRTTFKMIPSRLGKQVLTITAPVDKMDEVPQNNTVHLSFDVIRDKFRVLHVAGRPSWDQRFLRDVLSLWPKVDLVSFYVLRTVYQSSTNGAAGLALIPFPAQDLFENHLDEFDVIIFQDFDPIAVGVDAYIEKVVDFVRAGGGLVLIGGADGFGSGAVTKPPFSKILPVELLPSSSSRERLLDASPFRARLTEAGRRHPLMKPLRDLKTNASLWKSAERLDGIVRVAKRVEGAVTLAEHPFITVDDGLAPLIITREVDKGRTLVITTDSTWRWRFEGPMKGGSTDLYAAFWKKAILWFTHDPALDRLNVQILSNRISKELPLTAEISLVDEAYEPRSGEVINIQISLLDSTDVEQENFREVRLDDDGKFQLRWQPNMAGPHTIVVSAPGEGLEVKKHFLVEAVGAELQRLDPDIALLSKISGVTGGEGFVDSLDINQLRLVDTPDKETLYKEDTPLWNHVGAMLLLLSLLLGEWILRRRLGLS